MISNAFTKGSEGVASGIIVNEDKTLVMQVVSYNEETQIVTARKVWDMINPGKLFYAHCVKSVFAGQFVVFFRVGDYNSNPSIFPTGFELDIENADKTSWLCISAAPLILVQIKNSLGVAVTYSNGQFVTVPGTVALSVVSSTPSTLFYSTIPLEEERVFLGQQVGNKYVVFLEGMSDTVAEIKGITAEGTNYTYTLGLNLTSDGRVLNFEGSATAPVDPVIYDTLIATLRNYDGDDDYNRFISPSYTTHPYAAFVPTNSEGAAHGFRQNASYMMAWQYTAWNAYGDLPSPFTAGGGDSVAYPLNVQFKKTITYPTGIIYADRHVNNWVMWDVGSSSWITPYQYAVDLRAMDYRTGGGDGDPVALRYGAIDSLQMLFYFP